MPAMPAWQQYSDPAMRIATVLGTSDAQAVRDLAPNATILSFKELSEASLAAQTGHADAIGTSILICLDIAKRRDPTHSVTSWCRNPAAHCPRQPACVAMAIDAFSIGSMPGRPRRGQVASTAPC